MASSYARQFTPAKQTGINEGERVREILDTCHTEKTGPEHITVDDSSANAAV